MAYADKMCKIEKLFKEVDEMLVNKKDDDDQYCTKQEVINQEDKEMLLTKLKSVLYLAEKKATRTENYRHQQTSVLG
jgi:tRNA splicing endonuclease